MSGITGIHPYADKRREMTATEFATEYARRMCLFGSGKKAKREQLVYFIQRGSGPIKIGISSNVEGRLRTLQIGSAESLTLLRTEPGGRARERRLHAMFGGDRMEGEWFKPTRALRDYISGVRA